MAEVHSFSDKATFLASVSERFGVEISAEEYANLLTRPQEQLLTEECNIENFSPQNSDLPEQIALTGADMVGDIIAPMRLTLLDAPDTLHFILGDTPLPDADIIQGFVVPIKAKLALQAESPAQEAEGALARRPATPTGVSCANERQYDMSAAVVIGPNPIVLDAL